MSEPSMTMCPECDGYGYHEDGTEEGSDCGTCFGSGAASVHSGADDTVVPESHDMSEAERQDVLAALARLKVCPECGALAIPASPFWDVRWGPTPEWSHYSVKDILSPLCPTFRTGVVVEPVSFLDFYRLPRPGSHDDPYRPAPARHVHQEWTQCRHRNGQCCAACHMDADGDEGVISHG